MRRWQKGALIGGAGLGLGFGVFAESWESCFLRSECDDEFHADAFFEGLVVGAALGAIAGALVGAMFEGETWRPIVVSPTPSTSFSWQLGVTLDIG